MALSSYGALWILTTLTGVHSLITTTTFTTTAQQLAKTDSQQSQENDAATSDTQSGRFLQSKSNHYPPQVPHALASIAVRSASLRGPFVVTGDYVELPEGGGVHGSAADFTIKCAKPSDLTFQMEVIAPNGNADSVFISVGVGSGRARWDTGLHQTWSWSRVSPSVAVPAGSHRLRLWGREDGIKIRMLKLVNELGEIGCYFTAEPEPLSETPAQTLEDTVLHRLCGVAASESHCTARSAEASKMHGFQCAWVSNRCQISTQEAGCVAATKTACQELARAAASGQRTCVWSGSTCYAFKPPISGCEFRDPDTCELDVSIQLASTGNVDPLAQEAFDWNAQTGEILRDFAVDSLIDAASGIPLIGGFLGAAGSIAGAFAGTDTSSGLCEATHDETTGACLFRHIAEYLDRYVTTRLEQEKISELQHAVNEATNQFVRLQTIIDSALGEGRDLDDVRRDDFDADTDRKIIDNLLTDTQHDMLQRLNFEFMNTETVYAPQQATYTAMFATATFQMWASQIVFVPTYQSVGWVQTLIDEIDAVTEWVLEQMNMAKQYRLDSVGEGSGNFRSSSKHGPLRQRRWYELKDEFPECPWTGPEVNRFQLQCGGRGCGHVGNEMAEEQARMCLQQRRDWVSWSQDTFWREALQVHLNAWQDLRNRALEWQNTF